MKNVQFAFSMLFVAMAGVSAAAGAWGATVVFAGAAITVLVDAVCDALKARES